MASNLPLSWANDEPRNNLKIKEDWVHSTHMPISLVYIQINAIAWCNRQYISAGQGIRLHLNIVANTIM